MYEAMFDEWYVTGYGVTLKALGNRNLSWEKTDKFDVGFDFQFFNQRLTITGDYFYEKTVSFLDYFPKEDTCVFLDEPNRLTEKVGENPRLRPDGKAQVSVEYDEDGKPMGIETVVVSIQHSEDYPMEELRRYVRQEAIAPVLRDYGFDLQNVEHIYINPTGKFVVGGPDGDTGLTGRKIIVDTYGGYFSHGGGAFSGKDPTKVDRSAAYMARYMAKNIVAGGLADKCQVELAYAIGVAQPVSVRVDTYGTGKVSDEKLTELLRDTFDMTPAGIIRALDLRKPIYADTAARGHFGIQGKTWEKTDKAALLRSKAGL